MPDISLETAIRTLPTNENTDSLRDSANQSSTVHPGTRPEVAKVNALEGNRLRSENENTTQEVLEELQSYADQLNRNLEFSVDDSSGRTVVTVRESSTDEVIRQIPSEEVLRFAKNFNSGGARLFDARA